MPEPSAPQGRPVRVGRTPRRERGWLRAAGLFFVAYMVPIAQAPVLIAVLFLELALVLGTRKSRTLLAVGLALVFVLPWSAWDGMSYLERAWGLMLGAWFAGLTVWRPTERFTTRALGAVGGAAASVAVFVAVRPNAWGILEQAVVGRLSAGATATYELLQTMEGGKSIPQAYVAAMDGMMHTMQTVFPAMLALGSFAAMGVAWWLYERVARDDDSGLGPLRDFRFNDHLVWIFVGGLVLTVAHVAAQWGVVLGRVGSNALVFMGVLYALRGVAVVLFLSSGAAFGWVVLLGLLAALIYPPIVLAGATVIGLGDTWLDIRSRVPST